MKCANLRSIARAAMPIRMERKPAHKSMCVGCLFGVVLSTVECSPSPARERDSALECPPSNVAAAKSAIPADQIHRGIGAGLCLGNAMACGGAIQHPPAHRHDIAVALFSSGMEDGNPGHFFRLVQSGD